MIVSLLLQLLVLPRLHRAWASAPATCLQDAIPVRADTAHAVEQLMRQVEASDGEVTKATPVRWKHGDQTRAAFLPPGSTLRGAISEARRQVRNNGTIAFTLPELRNTTKGYPLKISLPMWASGAMASTIFSIIVQEGLRLHTNFSHAHYRSDGAMRALAGCPIAKNAACNLETAEESLAEVLLESWESGRQELKRLHHSLQPRFAGQMGYLGTSGIFVRTSLFDPEFVCKIPFVAAKNHSCAGKMSKIANFDFYRTYNVSRYPETHRYFDNISYMLSRISTSETTPCAEWGKKNIDTRFYSNQTQDSQGWRVVDGVVVPNCSDDDRVWRSPACRDSPSKCIPWVTFEGMGLHVAMQQAYFWHMPLAIVDLSMEAWLRVGRDLRVLLWWWLPDPTFDDMVQVLMPTHNRLQFSHGLYKTGESTSEVSKYATHSLAYQEIKVWKLLDKFFLDPSEMEFAMRDLHVRGYDSDLVRKEHVLKNTMADSWADVDNRDRQLRQVFHPACHWIVTNLDKWTKWITHTCKAGRKLSLENNICERCHPGTWGDGEKCHSCTSGKFSAEYAALQCDDCPAGTSSSVGQEVCQTVAINKVLEEVIKKEHVLAPVLGSAFLISCVCLWFHMRRVARDAPDKEATSSGSFVLRWVGPHIHQRLVRVSRSSTFMSRIDTSASFKVVKRSVQRFVRPCWVVNASPFSVTLTFPHKSVALGKYSFEQVQRHWLIAKTVSLNINTQGDPCEEWTPEISTAFAVVDSDWAVVDSNWRTKHKLPLDEAGDIVFRPGKKGKSRRSVEVARKTLPISSGGDDTGQIKLVLKHSRKWNLGGKLLLVVWSPPHIYRGIPLDEFQLFLTRAINHKHETGPKLKDSPSKKFAEGKKQPMRKESGMNMYDINQEIVIKEAARLDASFAEIATLYGPPEIFISHVWAEKAEVTKHSLEWLSDWMQERFASELLAAGTVTGSSDCTIDCSCRNATASTSETRMPSTSGSAIVLRIWFCTLANNQARVAEEIGDNISVSPFVKVIRSPSVKTVALISPLKALERKWCTLEFSFALSARKETLIVTREGVVQAGQVAPRFLQTMAQKLVTFDSASATCFSKTDEAMINSAVAEMGGFNVINDQLRTIFTKAIEEAAIWVQQSRNCLASGLQVQQPIDVQQVNLSETTSSRVIGNASFSDTGQSRPASGRVRTKIIL